MRQTTIFTLLVAAVMSVALFFLKYEVTHLEEELDRLNRSIDQHQEAMHVLRAEWGHLTEIERVRALSHRYLDLGPTNPIRIVTIDELPAAAETSSFVSAPVPQPQKKAVR
jgi:cell division protein FtsL